MIKVVIHKMKSKATQKLIMNIYNMVNGQVVTFNYQYQKELMNHHTQKKVLNLINLFQAMCHMLIILFLNFFVYDVATNGQHAIPQICVCFSWSSSQCCLIFTKFTSCQTTKFPKSTTMSSIKIEFQFLDGSQPICNTILTFQMFMQVYWYTFL